MDSALSHVLGILAIEERGIPPFDLDNRPLLGVTVNEGQFVLHGVGFTGVCENEPSLNLEVEKHDIL